MLVKREASWGRIQWIQRCSMLMINMVAQIIITEWQRFSKTMGKTTWWPKLRIPIKLGVKIKWTRFKCSKMQQRCKRKARRKQEEILLIKKAKRKNRWAKVEVSKRFKYWVKSKHWIKYWAKLPIKGANEERLRSEWDDRIRVLEISSIWNSLPMQIRVLRYRSIIRKKRIKPKPKPATINKLKASWQQPWLLSKQMRCSKMPLPTCKTTIRFRCRSRQISRFWKLAASIKNTWQNW